MSLVRWEEILPNSAKVLYSSLSVPDEPDEFDRDIVAIRLPGRYFIDVEWSEAKKKYIVTLFQGEFENVVHELFCDTASDVVETVKYLEQIATDGEIQTSFATSSRGSVEAEYEGSLEAESTFEEVDSSEAEGWEAVYA